MADTIEKIIKYIIKAKNMEKIITIPNKLNINEYSYKFLAKTQYDIYACNESDIILDFQDCQFIAPAFTAYFGVLMEMAKKWGKSVNIRSPHSLKVMNYFKNSGFYNYYSGNKYNYANPNSIPFTKVNLDDCNLINYIDNILDLAPITLSPDCRDSLFKNIYEIFNNATDHSNSSCGVFACGHWMPNKNQLIFSVCDTGTGIPRLVKQQNSNMTSIDAIKWALQRGNSTKQMTDGAPRGLGMADLKDFTELNNGSLIIFSNDVYYNHSKNREEIRLPYDVLGTLITVIITADREHIYTLKEEQS